MAANRPQLARLVREINEHVELAVFSGREAVIVDQLAPPDRLRGVTKVGKSFSLYASCLCSRNSPTTRSTRPCAHHCTDIRCTR
ncbi:IclR family transcriptional regulator domain-containing protein [Nocardia vinacea]|uniref:IclR family transcriptional regulator domain-containing protein n=1 Tax=Nocardia vinacea TaxID=96468 RepID=UPI003AF3835F